MPERIREIFMKLTVIGSGDAFSSGGRLNSCYHFATQETSFLLDCGAGALAGLRQQKIDLLKIDTIIISHLHGDHFAGLPFFLLDALHISNRRSTLIIIGPKRIQEKLEALCAILYEGLNLKDLPFDIRYAGLNKFQLLSSNGVTIQALPAKHTKSSDPYCMRLSYKNLTIGYSGDTAWTDSLISVAINTDLFITECSQWDKESDIHLDYLTLSRKIDLLSTKKILLTHMNPAMLERIDQIDLDHFVAAYDGMIIDI